MVRCHERKAIKVILPLRLRLAVSSRVIATRVIATRVIAAFTLASVATACHSGAASPRLAPGASASATLTASAADSVTLANAQSGKLSNARTVVLTADVANTVAGVFGDSITPFTLMDAVPTSGPTWDIDVHSYEGQERVAFYVNLFTQKSRTRFQERLQLGTRYDPMIRAKLRAGGIPEDMSFLAMVESGYDPNAYSSAAAVGMWQFMSSTARDVGLRVDWWVDERRDPARSTDGAIRFLRDLQNQFGSLYLAAAAYNGGPGRVSRGLTRFAEEMEGSEGEDRFFALAEQDYLRSETKNYVPQIIAAALVGKDPVRYGFAYDTLPKYTYDSVEVAAGTPLAAVAKAALVDVEVIRELNPAVLRGMAPPTSSLWVRVPCAGVVSAPEISAALAALPDDEQRGFRIVKTTGAESSASIASRAGITAKQLSWYNPSLRSTRKGKLVAAQAVRVPTLATVAAAANVPDPSIERYGTAAVAAGSGASVHVVRPGESLGLIAQRYHITVSRLKSLNGLRSDKIVIGQKLRVTGGGKATAAKKPAASTVKKTAAKTAAKPIMKPVAKAAKATASKTARKTAPKATTKATTKATSKVTTKATTKAGSKR